ncbi:amidohydrolase [Falsiroseomonas oryzae]|uniref:amidohydrolase n=1 Tax=Falsiroseomonas oryzae TaxID=2766473 RepID=UPI0022EB3AFC|nr:amidohydrolase [Roseomonas sp. MO-31]
MNADFVLLGGRIATMDAAGTECSALAALHGRIVALGTDDAMRQHIGPGTTVLQAEGRRVLPGIVDSHAHPDAYAIRLRAWTLVSPDRVRTRDELLATIRRRCAELPPGRWAAFYRLNERQSGGYPTLDELDAASGGRPLFILRTDGHLGLANRAAFAACGIDATTPDPPFGRFDKLDGKLTGLVRETAAHIFLNAVHGQDSEADIAEGMELVQDQCLAAGITSVANSLCPAKAIRAYQRMRREGRWRMRMGIIASGRDEPLIPHLIGAGIRSGFGDEWVRLVGVEWCPDCSTSGRTAAYWEPYVGTPIPGEPVPNTGMLLYEKEDLTRRATAAHEAGLQVMIEGVGDRGIDFALDVMEAALAAHPVADHRMRVEHCCYVTPPILDRLRRGGFVDSSATGFMDELGEAYAANRGQDAMRWMWPHRSLIDAGVPAPGHSDFAVCRVSPWTAIAAMVNRRTTTGADLDAREAVTPREALRAYTWLGAWAQREEDEKGSLEPGKLADLVVLDRDVLEGDPSAIAGTQVVATVVGGMIRHRM